MVAVSSLHIAGGDWRVESILFVTLDCGSGHVHITRYRARAIQNDGRRPTPSIEHAIIDNNIISISQ